MYKGMNTEFKKGARNRHLENFFKNPSSLKKQSLFKIHTPAAQVHTSGE